MFSEFFGSLSSSLLSGFDFGGGVFRRLGRNAAQSFGKYLDDKMALESPDGKINFAIEDLRNTNTDPYTIIPEVFGTVKMAGQVIWLSPIETSLVSTTILSAGGWGVFPDKPVSEYVHSVSIALAVGKGEIADITHIYADGALVDRDILEIEIFKGTMIQSPSSTIVSYEGSEISAFKGIAYIVIKNIPLELFGGNLPKFEFTVVKPSAIFQTFNESITSLCLIPASGEFIYATTLIDKEGAFHLESENKHASAIRTDMSVTISDLKNTYPNLVNISLVVGWFFDHTDPRLLTIRPAIEDPYKETQPLSWSVASYNRSTARYLSFYNGSPAYGGTPADFSVEEAIIALGEVGYKVTFYPFLFGDIPHNHPNGLPAYPWRGRIKPQGTDTEKGAGVTNFFSEYRAMILHYANMINVLNSNYGNIVDLFVIGSELVGLTHAKFSASFPAITQLRTLAADVRAILGTGVKLTYGADWTEYSHYKHSDNSISFPLDPLWSHPAIDYVGLDWYAPLTDWRDSDNHLDGLIFNTIYDLNYLKDSIESREAYDFYYADANARDAQTRLSITDGAYSKPWIYRAKDIRNWWKNYHYARTTTGVESVTPTSWVPASKPIIFTEIGCPAVDKGSNSPNLFPDIKSSENGIPPYSTGERDDKIQIMTLLAYKEYWEENNETIGGVPMIDLSRMAIWCVDARPFPTFPLRDDIWGDTPAFYTGHWITARSQIIYLSEVITKLFADINLTVVFDDRADKALGGYIFMGRSSYYQQIADLIEVYDLFFIPIDDGAIFITSREELWKKPSNQIDEKRILSFEVREDRNLPTKAELKHLGYDAVLKSNITLYEAETHLIKSFFMPLVMFLHETEALLKKYLITQNRYKQTQIEFSLYAKNLEFKVGDKITLYGKVYLIESLEREGEEVKIVGSC